MRGRRAREWHLSDTWLLFSGALLPFLLFLPDPLQGRYFFAVRMGVLFFVGMLAAASTALRRWRSIGLAAAGFAYLLCFYTLGLAVHYITPAARALATLQHAPPIAPGGLPGLTMQPSGANDTPNLGFIPDNWGTAQYYRRNNLVLFNTAWLGDPLILVGVQPGKLHDLDSSYFESVPWYGSDFMPDDDTGSAILNKVGFVVMMRHNASVLENPFAENENETVPAKYARDWACTHDAEQAWYLCRRKKEPKLKEGK